MVVLNTDTVLPRHWMEQLLNVASTTPFSNCATICGFPDMPQDNPRWLGLGTETIDQGLARIRPEAVRLDIPTGVGFCMAMARSNDWCQRAAAAGFDNLLVPNLFAWHEHGGSFPNEEKHQLIERNLAIDVEQSDEVA